MIKAQNSKDNVIYVSKHTPCFNKEEIIDKVFCGDRIEVMKKIPDESVHFIITSPPYNVGIKYDNHHDLMLYNEYLEFLNDTWKECYRILVKGGRIAINVPSITADGEYQPLFADVINQMRALKYIMRGDILWYKQSISKRTAWGSWQSPSNPYVVQP
ncbi:MAG: DNA methyltransferase, partial [Bacteroidia bacterium]|nr:DNA methyltransferase [Bacteroidia bacterium]